MGRTLWFFIKLALLIAAGVWLAERPGEVSLEWLGYRVETTIGILLLAVFVLMVAAAGLYRFWTATRRAPGEIRRSFSDSRRERGYKALTQGMVAVAAGAPDEALRLSRRADGLLDEPPLTLLLSAQAAQLNGDEEAAKRYFKAMLEREETAFLGLRGLFNQAMKEGDEEAALDYVRKAKDLRPDTPWVAEMLFKLELRHGKLESAEQALALARPGKDLSKEALKRRRAVLAAEKGRAAFEAGRFEEAARHLSGAVKLQPALAPAAALLARVQIKRGEKRKAQRLLIKSWYLSPHPALVKPFLDLEPQEKPLERVKRLGKLVSSRPSHPESHLAQARAALDAQLWGEARRHLTAAGGQEPTEAVCRLMAELEEAENGDSAKAHEWFRRAATAPNDPTWVCSNCGAAATDWSAVCRACGEIDSLDWRSPLTVGSGLLPEMVQPQEEELEADPAASAPQAAEGAARGA
jgi:HemY protein